MLISKNKIGPPVLLSWRIKHKTNHKVTPLEGARQGNTTLSNRSTWEGGSLLTFECCLPQKLTWKCFFDWCHPNPIRPESPMTGKLFWNPPKMVFFYEKTLTQLVLNLRSFVRFPRHWLFFLFSELVSINNPTYC